MATQNVMLEMEAVVSARMERSDYGVPGSPVWDEPTDLEVDEVVIGGVSYDRKTLVEKMGQQGADFLFGLLAEAADGDWEEEEPDYPDYDDEREYAYA
jgi:hypothetical protein